MWWLYTLMLVYVLIMIAGFIDLIIFGRIDDLTDFWPDEEDDDAELS